MMTEKNLHDLAVELGKHGKLFRRSYPDFNPDLQIATSGLIETFLFRRLRSGKE